MSLPQLSLGSWAFTFGTFAGAPWSFDHVIRYAAESGYEGVEISGFRPHPHPDDFDTRAKCRRLIAEIGGLGLGISGYAPDFTAAPPAEVDSDAYLRVLRRCLRFCTACSITTLRVDTASPPVDLPDDEYEARFARLARTWRLAAEEASHDGIRIVWEFEPGFWLNKPTEVKRMAQAVDHDHFWLLFDTSHAYMGAVEGSRQPGEHETLPGGVAEYARLLSGFIGHLHLTDCDGTLYDDETSRHAALGEGYVDLKAMLAALSPTVGRLPWWCIDYGYNPRAARAAREAVPFAHALMEGLGLKADA